MPSYIDLTGYRFGKLSVIRDVGRRNNNALWECICDCGEVTNVQASSLRGGKTNSCGCFGKAQRAKANTKHGMHKTDTYQSWEDMIGRCTNKNNSRYQYYGARGIAVCKEWRDFKNFLRDMGERPTGFEIDRINVNAGYEPNNCHWVSRKENMRNTRRNLKISFRGQTKCLGEWCEILGMKYGVAYGRYRKYGNNSQLLFSEYL